MPLLCATKKLLIRPMLMHGRAQAFCFDESATGRADSLAESDFIRIYTHYFVMEFLK